MNNFAIVTLSIQLSQTLYFKMYRQWLTNMYNVVLYDLLFQASKFDRDE